jgi:hypothetical protein
MEIVWKELAMACHLLEETQENHENLQCKYHTFMTVYTNQIQDRNSCKITHDLQY